MNCKDCNTYMKHLIDSIDTDPHYGTEDVTVIFWCKNCGSVYIKETNEHMYKDEIYSKVEKWERTKQIKQTLKKDIEIIEIST